MALEGPNFMCEIWWEISEIDGAKIVVGKCMKMWDDMMIVNIIMDWISWNPFLLSTCSGEDFVGEINGKSHGEIS